MEEFNQITNTNTFEEPKNEKCLSNAFQINVKVPIKGFKPDKKFVTLFDEIKQPNLEKYYDDFNIDTLNKIFNDYFFELKEMKKKLENININFENDMEPIILKTEAELHNLKDFINNVNNFQTKNISNVNYKIKLLAKEEIFEIYNKEEVQITKDND